MVLAQLCLSCQDICYPTLKKQHVGAVKWYTIRARVVTGNTDEILLVRCDHPLLQFGIFLIEKPFG